MKAYFVRIKKDELESNIDPFVGIFFADNMLALGDAIDQKYDPGICEVAEIDIINEGIFLELIHETEDDEKIIKPIYAGATDDLENLFHSVDEGSLEWHDPGNWSDQYMDKLQEIISNMEVTQGYELNTQRITYLFPYMSKEEKKLLNDWEEIHLGRDSRYSTSDWPGWPDVFKRLSH